MSDQKSKQRMGYLVFAAVACGVGIWIDDPYYIQVLILIGLNTILALGLNLLMGYAGQISLGHAAFYGIGAYTTAVLSTTYGWSPWLALFFSIGLSSLVALIVGLPTLKLSGYYLGMGTLGFGMIVNIAIREWASVTGGASGFIGVPPLEIGSYSLMEGNRFFFLVWGIVLVAVVMSNRIIDSRSGRALRAIHDHEAAAGSVGINTQRLKLQVFILSASMGGLAGFLYAHYISFISPGSFNFLASVRMVTMVVIGGMASVWGALLGAGLLTLLPEFLHAFSEFEMIVYGLVLMVVMIFMPQGLTRGVLDMYERFKKRQKNEPGSQRSIGA